MSHSQDLEKRILQVFKRVFHRDFSKVDKISVREVEEWDSLSHVVLMIELETEFDIQIDPESIALLYSSFSVIHRYLKVVLQED